MLAILCIIISMGFPIETATFIISILQTLIAIHEMNGGDRMKYSNQADAVRTRGVAAFEDV